MTTLPYYEDDTVIVHHGDCLDILATLPDSSVDAVCTDPPYGLGFMGKEWDSIKQAESRPPSADETDARYRNVFPRTGKGPAAVSFDGHAFQAWCELWATECLRVLKPGGHLLAFGGTRTSHRLTCAVEDAGFEIRDSIAWLYGSGFPKSLDVSKAIDKAAGVEREVLRPRLYEMTDGGGYSGNLNTSKPRSESAEVTAPATDAARTWQGWGTALKPAHEPVVVARKPLVGTVAGNVLAHGTGGLNIDGCRVDATDKAKFPVGYSKGMGNDTYAQDDYTRGMGREHPDPNPAGRWPANVVLDESQATALDQMSGESGGVGVVKVSSGRKSGGGSWNREDGGLHDPGRENVGVRDFGDSGGASRFFYTAKADAAERVRIDGTAHPTVKPLALMRWLVRLVTPPGGVVLEPFAGSGTTVEACILEGFRCVAIEREADYLPLILQRIHRRRDPVAAVLATAEDGGLFDLLGEEPA